VPEAVIELFVSQPEFMAGWFVALIIIIVVLAGLVMRLAANKHKSDAEFTVLNNDLLETKSLLQAARYQTAMGEQRAENLENALNEQKDGAAEYRQDSEQWRQRASGLDNRVASLESELEGRKRQLTQVEEERQSLQQKVDMLVKELHDAQVNVREQEVTLDKERRTTTEKLELLERNRDALKQEFENLANKIFEQKSEHFSKQTRTSLDTLLNPFRDQLQDFRKRVEDVYTTETRDRQALRSEIKSLQELNRQITEEASNLTRALKGDKKIQGNWGELILERVLEKSGLRKGIEYETQGSYRDRDNQVLRPDVVVFLPDNRNLVIDSKVSLVAYQQWVIGKDDQTREEALKLHVEAVRHHIRTLSEKDYSQLSGLHSPDFVFLFMPIEPAFVAAFQQDDNLFTEAFERKIIVVTPTTLLATLRTIENIWRYERQSQNARRIAERAAAVYDKLRVFVEAMERLGVQLHTAQGSYDSAMNTLTRGRGNLISQANRFVELGVRVKKELPKVIVDQAEVDAMDEIGAADEQPSKWPDSKEQAADADNQKG
jgi:DNA recombination protein RmuC